MLANRLCSGTDKAIPNNNSSGINLDIEENSPFQEGIISETIQRLDKTFFQKPKSLEDIIDTGNLIHKFLPKQMDINKILQIIQRKLDVDFSYCWLNLEVKLYSLEQYIGLIEDKLSSTTVNFFRSEGYLELSAYIGLGSLRSAKSVNYK